MTTNSAALKLVVKKYLHQMKIDWRYAVPGFVLPGVGSAFITYVPPLIVAEVIKKFDGARPTAHDLVPYVLLFAGAWVIGEVFWRIALFALIRFEIRGMKRLYVDAMDELLYKDIGFFHDNFAGSLTKKVVGYAKSFEGFSDTISMTVLSRVIPLGFAVVVLWRFSPWLVLVLATLLVVAGMVLIPLTKRRQRLVAVSEKASNKTAGNVADIIGNMDAVQAFAHQKREAATHKLHVVDYLDKTQKSWDFQNMRIDIATAPMVICANVAGLLVALLLSGDSVSLATVFVTFTYFVNATYLLWEFNRIYRNIERALTEGAQFTELLLAPPAISDRADAKPLAISKGEIKFSDVQFAYHSDDDPLFDNFNLHIRSGEKVALVGHSGGGKTTVTKLLLRFIEVTGGALLIDGQDITKGTMHDLRRAIAYVPQEPVMFHRSIRENIRYGQPDASDDDVIKAAKKAHAHEFIQKLPQGYDTLVGERGIKLSGGQRQRIAIARAIIKNAPILVLDEATSALDSESEKLIQEALWELMKGRTTIVIAHRLSTIQKMDRIVVLDNGTIAESGSHQDLLKTGGIYSQLWAHQSGGFIEE